MGMFKNINEMKEVRKRRKLCITPWFLVLKEKGDECVYTYIYIIDASKRGYK